MFKNTDSVLALLFRVRSRISLPAHGSIRALAACSAGARTVTGPVLARSSMGYIVNGNILYYTYELVDSSFGHTKNLCRVVSGGEGRFDLDGLHGSTCIHYRTSGVWFLFEFRGECL